MEKRRQALKDTKFELNFRTFYFDRSDFNGSEKQAWAIGGWLGVKTGYFLDHVAFGATVYTSNPIYAPDDRDGTLLLAPGQNGYTVLGEFYTELRIVKDVGITVGAKGYDTPFINRNDTRMTPNTFEAVVLQGRTKLGTSSSDATVTDGRRGPEQRWKRGRGPVANPGRGRRVYQVRSSGISTKSKSEMTANLSRCQKTRALMLSEACGQPEPSMRKENSPLVRSSIIVKTLSISHMPNRNWKSRLPMTGS